MLFFYSNTCLIKHKYANTRAFYLLYQTCMIFRLRGKMTTWPSVVESYRFICKEN